jgi:hypothetical protein
LLPWVVVVAELVAEEMLLILEEQTIGTTDTTLAATAALVGAEVGLGQEERLLSQYRHMEALEIVDIMVKVKAIRANQQ